MTSNSSGSVRGLGSLHSVGGAGVIRLEERFDTGIDEVWSALTDRDRLAHWYGEVEGELRVAGEFRARLHASGWEGVGHVDACEPPRRLRITSKDPDEPHVEVTELTLTGDGEQTTLSVEQRGLPLDRLWAYGAGLQIHVEDLGAHLAGGGRVDARMRFGELEPVYRDMAAGIGSV